MYKQALTSKAFDILNIIFMILLSLTFIYPILSIFAISISSPDELGFKQVGILPVGFSIDSYITLLSDGKILRYYFNTIFYSASATFVLISLTSLMAYPLTLGNFKLKNFIIKLLAIAMFFDGGIVALYLVVRQLKMIDTVWSIIIPQAIIPYYVIMFKTFFQEIPPALRESALIDGAGEVRILLKIIMPLSKPLLATFTLFSMIGFWNDYIYALIFLNKDSMYPIQLLLRKIVVLLDMRDIESLTRAGAINLDRINPRTVKGAATIITILPIICVYPFLQKYFTKGFIVGALKA